MKRLLVFLGVGFSAGCGPEDSGSAPVSPTVTVLSLPSSAAGDRLARAEELLRRDRLAEAAEEFRGVLALDEKNVPALVGLSRIAGRMEDGPTSLNYISKAAELRQDDGSIANQLGVAQVACGQKQEAYKTFERAIKLSPKDPLILLNAAQNRADLGDWDGARRLAEGAAELLPADATPWLLLGRYQMRQEKFQEAVRFLREASRRAPENGTVHYHLGKSLVALGRRDEAAKAFRISLRGDPPPEVRTEIEKLLSGR